MINLNRKKLIHYGTGDDVELMNKARFCLENNLILVFITPAVKDYHPNILEAKRLLDDTTSFWIYEMNMGMKTVLAKRANDYFINHLDSFFEYPAVSDYNLDDCLCCYVETDISGKLDRDLIRSCQIFDTPITCIGKGEHWENLMTRVRLYIDFLSQRTEKFVITTDGRDVLYADNYKSVLKLFLDKFYVRGHKIVFNAETNCYPNKELAIKHPCQDKKYKYLNAGCFVGERVEAIKFWEDCLSIPDKLLKDKFFDQERAHHVFINRVKNNDLSVWLDYNCDIFQVLWDENGGRSANFDMEYYSDKIYNNHTGTYPKIFHYPGPTGHGNTVWKVINRVF